MSERDFIVCSDCVYFEEKELIDERYPILKRGHCKYFNKDVDNRWEVNCEEFDDEDEQTCDKCKWFYEDEDMIYRCMYYDEEIEWYHPTCENFELF